MARRLLLHVDLDEFIAAVERLRRPELEGKPIVVGGDGDPTKRGVVSTASYEARAFGIRSAMPLRTAAKRNPDAIFLPVDANAYHVASRGVMDALRSFGRPVEVLGWDEAYVAVDDGEPESLAWEMQRRVLERTRLWCTVGIGDNRLQAKLASNFGKPRGVFRITGATWPDLMYGLPAVELWGVGSKTAAKLVSIGVRTVGDLANAPEERLAERFGPRTGPWLQRLARGESSSDVRTEPWVPKGIGRERTFQRNLTERAQIDRELERLCDELAADVAAEGRAVVRVVVKVRFAPFFTQTRSVSLGGATSSAAVVRDGVRTAIDRFDLHRPVRLLGVRAELEPAGDRVEPPADAAAGDEPG